jgi:hypothetical protein
MLYVDEDCIRRGGFDKKFHKGEKSIFKKATKVVVLRLTADTSALSSTVTTVMWDSSLDAPLRSMRLSSMHRKVSLLH